MKQFNNWGEIWIEFYSKGRGITFLSFLQQEFPNGIVFNDSDVAWSWNDMEKMLNEMAKNDKKITFIKFNEHWSLDISPK